MRRIGGESKQVGNRNEVNDYTTPPPKKNKITKLVTMKGGWKMNTDKLLSSPEQPSLGWVGLIGEKVLRPNCMLSVENKYSKKRGKP